MIVGDITENELLRALVEENYLPPLDPALDVTAEMLAATTGYTKRHAADLLQARERAGELVSHWVRSPHGRRIKAYRKA